MEDNLLRYLEWFAAVLLILAAASSFFARYAGFVRMVGDVEKLALSDSVVKQVDGGQDLNAFAPMDEMDEGGLILFPFRSGLVGVSDGNDLRGICMLAARDNVWDEPILVDGRPLVQLDLAEIPDDARYRVTYSLNAEGSVTRTSYDSLPR